MDEYNIKAPIDVLLDLPQEKFTGDVLKGRGTRRGNLERLLRYWRPIMKKPGGFRRCRVILADHHELYPLNNICAWLHHETTGLWPNEGCHHPGMKNCRRKLKKGKNGSLFSDSQFNNRLRKLNGPGKKSADDVFFWDEWNTKGLQPYENDENPVVTTDDIKHAILVLVDFAAMEPDFCKYLRDDSQWDYEGEMEDGAMFKSAVPPSEDCGCDK